MDESIDGDIDLSIQNISNPFVLGLGSNTIQGTQARVTNSTRSDVDDFYFSVPPDLKLAGMSFEVTTLTIEGAPTDGYINPYVGDNSIYIPLPT